MKSLIEIEQVVCDVFGVTSEFIHEKSRDSLRFLYRYIIGYLSRKINDRKITFKAIGKYLNIDHSTMQWGMRVINNQIDTDPKFKEDVIECLKRLNEKTKLADNREEIKKEIFEILNQVFIDTADRLHLFNLVSKL